MSRQPPEPEGTERLVDGAAWFWHTAADTIDKIDPNILLNDSRIYMASLWRLCTHPVLPINFLPVADEFEKVITGLHSKASGAFDLTPALERAAAFRTKADELLKVCRRVAAETPDESFGPVPVAEALNRCLMKLSRILMPINYSAVDPFDMDLAVPIPPLPRLQPVIQLAAMNSNSHDFKFLERKMIRERNRVCYALEEATELIEETLGTKRI
jgi:hypothetical protein